MANWGEWQNRRDFLDQLGKMCLEYKSLHDFYRITVDIVRQNGAAALMDVLYGGSMVNLLEDVYPNFHWHSWKLTQAVSNGYWDDRRNQRLFLDVLGKELGFVKMEDWYGVTAFNILQYGGNTLLSQFGGSPQRLLQSVYSEYCWELAKPPSL